MNTAELSKEQAILRAMRKTLGNVVRDVTPLGGRPNPLTGDTIQDIKDCFALISERERELAELLDFDQAKPSQGRIATECAGDQLREAGQRVGNREQQFPSLPQEAQLTTMVIDVNHRISGPALVAMDTLRLHVTFAAEAAPTKTGAPCGSDFSRDRHVATPRYLRG